jgi:PAS domain S-box-containing protein
LKMTDTTVSYLRGSTLLIVDTSPVDLAVVAKSLEKYGVEFLMAEQGEDALQHAEIYQPDLILLEVMMSGLDGFEICRKLKANPVTSNIPVIFMSLSTAVFDKANGFAAGGIDYLAKPLQLDEVKLRVGTHLRLHALEQKLEESNSSLNTEITERKHQVQALLEESEFRQSLLKAIRGMDIQLVVIEDGRIVYISNPELAIQYGFTKKNIAEHPPLAEIIHPDDRARVLKYYRRWLAGEEVPLNYDVGLLTTEGMRREFEVSMVVIPGSRPVRVVSCWKEITERKQMLNELHRREVAFRAMVENTPDTIARYDSSYHQVYANPSLQKLLGVSNVFSISLNGYRRVIEEVMETGCESEYTLSWQAADSRTHWSQIRIVPEHNAQGDVASVLAIGRDISELVEAENRLSKSQELLRKLLVSQEVDYDTRQKRAAWEVYDSLGQLLMVQRMNIGMLQSGAVSGELALSVHLDKMRAVTDRAIGIVRSVGNELRPAAFNMGVPLALEWIIEMFHKDTNVFCELILAENDVNMDDTHANMLFHVVQDALDNITRHADAGRASVTLARDNGYYVLHVRDDGKGMDLNSPLESNLGLFYIQERVHAIGGEVVLFSQDGVGNLLEVRLPVSASSGSRAEGS